MDYRLLTEEETLTLESNGCWAEDWTSVNVADGFDATYLHHVNFYGEVNLGAFDKTLEVAPGFFKHTGICNATLRNVTIGDNCLIEHINNHINNYVIGDECHICNVSTMETTDGATFGEGNLISVLNEAGNGNVMLFSGLTAPLAALMIDRVADKDFTSTLRKLIRSNIEQRVPEVGHIGNGVKIIDTAEITNTHIGDDCEVAGARRLSDCTLTTDFENTVYIGTAVICENSIIADGASVTNGANVSNCYVGECSQLTNSFTAESSLFFVNSFLANGEACAAFCGPFTASHHKSTLLIGGMFSFYNAGSATNFSNHAYKMGPLHYGILQRGSKTASGAHLLMPAQIGAFSVCLNKISNHPDTTKMPFSYVIGSGRDTLLVPGKNIATVGLFRDVIKWPRRDIRPFNGKKSAVNYQWLNPVTIGCALNAWNTLQNIRKEQEPADGYYIYNNCKISCHSLQCGIQYYAIAISMFIDKYIRPTDTEAITLPAQLDTWTDLAGLLLPVQMVDEMVCKTKEGLLTDIQDLVNWLNASNNSYEANAEAFALAVAARYMAISSADADTFALIKQQADEARKQWKELIRQDALKEMSMGDVGQDVLDKFMEQLDKQAI